MATGTRNDPYRGFNFRLEVDGLTIASFSEASGLVAEGDPVDYREGADMVNSARKLAGPAQISEHRAEARLHPEQGALGLVPQHRQRRSDDRRNGAIVLMDEAHKDVLRWNFRNAWLNKVEGPSFNATGNEVAMESIELVHEGVDIDV